MKITDYLAIWGAVVASIVAVWNFYKDFLRRHRLKVRAGFQVLITGDGSPREEVFVVVVTTYRIGWPRSRTSPDIPSGATSPTGSIVWLPVSSSARTKYRCLAPTLI